MARKAIHSRYRRPLFILIILLSLFLCVVPCPGGQHRLALPLDQPRRADPSLPPSLPSLVLDPTRASSLPLHQRAHSLGTVIVLSSVTWFFGVRNWALLSERDVPYLPNENWAERVRGNSSFEEGGGWAYDPNWDGVVERTETWEHLENIEPLCVPFPLPSFARLSCRGRSGPDPAG